MLIPPRAPSSIQGNPHAVDEMTIATMVHPVVAVTKEGARSSSAIRRRASSSDRFADVGFADLDDPDAPSSAFFDGGGGVGGDGDLFSSLLVGFADDPIMADVMEGLETCGIDVADMTNKALAAFFSTPGIADADFSSPGALADPAASLGLIAPILLALRDDDEGDCGENDSSVILDAFEGYLQCSGGTLTRMCSTFISDSIIHRYLTRSLRFPVASIQSFFTPPPLPPRHQ